MLLYILLSFQTKQLNNEVIAVINKQLSEYCRTKYEPGTSSEANKAFHLTNKSPTYSVKSNVFTAKILIPSGYEEAFKDVYEVFGRVLSLKSLLVGMSKGKLDFKKESEETIRVTYTITLVDVEDMDERKCPI